MSPFPCNLKSCVLGCFACHYSTWIIFLPCSFHKSSLSLSLSSVNMFLICHETLLIKICPFHQKKKKSKWEKKLVDINKNLITQLKWITNWIGPHIKIVTFFNINKKSFFLFLLHGINILDWLSIIVLTWDPNWIQL